MPLRLIQIDSFPGTVQEVARLSPVHTKKEIKTFTFVEWQNIADPVDIFM